MAACYSESGESASAAHSHSRECHGKERNDVSRDCLFVAMHKLLQAQQGTDFRLVLERCLKETGHGLLSLEVIDENKFKGTSGEERKSISVPWSDHLWYMRNKSREQADS